MLCKVRRHKRSVDLFLNGLFVCSFEEQLNKHRKKNLSVRKTQKGMIGIILIVDLNKQVTLVATTRLTLD
jgi:hypothetical protein